MNLTLTENGFRRNLPLVLLVIAAVALGSAYIAEFVYDLKPCTLCLYQRIPFAVIGILGVAAYLFNNDKTIILVTFAAGLVLLASSGLALYHVGVEQNWWASATLCGTNAPDYILTMNQFHALLKQKPVIACDDVAWKIFGISMAAYNAGLSLFLGLGVLWIANRMRCF